MNGSEIMKNRGVTPLLAVFGAVLLLLSATLAQASLFDKLTGKNDKPLPVDQAYSLSVEPREPGVYALNWTITDNYYLYRDKIKLHLPDNLVVTDRLYSPSEAKDDPLFGQVQVYYQQAEVLVRLQRLEGTDALADDAEIEVEYQGCWEGGICYPPVRQSFPVADLTAVGSGKPQSLSALNGTSTDTAAAVADETGDQGFTASSLSLTDQNQVGQVLASGDWWLILSLFFVAGLALSLTPCVFPMVPILAGVIAGTQGAKASHYPPPHSPAENAGDKGAVGKAFWLSLVYVLAMSVTYTLAGVFAGLFGENLQILFQTPVVIIVISLLFVIFALAMFGVIHMQMPHFIQDKLSWAFRSQRGGTVFGVAVMGFLSALIVGPCVAAPLAGALIFIGQSGDPWLGGSALFVMSLGMGLPLLLVGASAGKWLPRSGTWMNTVKSAFGVVMLLMAIWMLDRIVPAGVTLVLTGIVLVITAIFLRVLDSLPHTAGPWPRWGKALGVLMLVYGLTLLVGAAAGGRSLIYPLQGFVQTGAAGTEAPAQSVEFTEVTSYTELEPMLAAAKSAGQPVMLDFYADWCVSCIELEQYTFADAQVQQALKRFRLIKVDVTDHGDASRALYKRYQIIGPPALVFYDTEGAELKGKMLVGVPEPGDFAAHIAAID